MTTFTWSVTSMSAYPQADNETNVVSEVFWNCTGTEIDGTNPETAQSYMGSINGSTPVSYNGKSPYTPYSQLTQEQVLNWVYEAGVSKTEVEAKVQSQIDNAKNPPVITPPLPF